MLFVATTINYMDRQVIAILAPTLQHSIGMTEADYGHVVAAFQIAYALGLVFVGRFVDKVGTRIGYMVIMAVWSLSAMGHALANSVLQFGIARVCLGLGESGNFPAAIKTVAEWFPQSERSLATGIFNSGTNVGAVLAPLIVPWIALRYGWHAAFLATGGFSALWIVLWFTTYRKPTEHTSLSGAELRHINQEMADKAGPSTPWVKLLGHRQTWAFSIAKFLTDPIWWFYLFWMPKYFSANFNLNLSHLGLPLIIIYNASAVAASAEAGCPRPSSGWGSRRPRRGWRPCCSAPAASCPIVFVHLSALGVGGHCAAEPGDGRAPGLVGQSLHHDLGHVSAQRGGVCDGHWRHGWLGGRRPAGFLRGSHSATDA